MAEACVLYTRSSKDTHDISPAAQRKELQAYAKRKGYRIVGDFSDAAVSANDNPPQLGQMLRELKNPDRKWSVILAVDSSRLARDADLAGVIAYETRKSRGRIEFAKQPTSGNAGMDVIISAIARAWDQYHSMVSKEKGLGGMRHNVELGHRAGGRAPLGYTLKHVETGTMRDGEPVRKSHLMLDPRWAPVVKQYLNLRLRGVRRIEASRKAGLAAKHQTTLIGIERNALTYAGATVWNRAPGRKMGEGQGKFRPRAEWVIQRNTHKALITEPEAEQLLERAMPRPERARRGASGRFLLSGLLFTPSGAAMVSNGDDYYRAGKGRRVRADVLEAVVLDHMNEEVDSSEFVDKFVSELKRAAKAMTSDASGLKAELKRIERNIASLLRFAEKAPESRALADRLRELEEERAECEEKIARADESASIARGLNATTSEQARRLIHKGWIEEDGTSVEERRTALCQIVDRIEFDPETGRGQVHYRLPLSRGARFDAQAAARELGMTKPGHSWRPHGDSNPGYRRERAMS